ncbi:MAG TPA: carbohydrate kinase [Tepidisphaeraceae bacterium]|nr:carbohydrate kinase [Tepidisphaeraceae bacterium]
MNPNAAAGSRASSPPPVALGVGEVLWDLLPSGRQLGGAPANFAFHAQQLGARGVVASAVGADILGDEIEERLQWWGVVSSIAIDHEHPTGTVSVTLDGQGVPNYVIHHPVAWDFLHNHHFPPATTADVVCFGTLAQRSPVSRQSIQRYLRDTRPDCLRVFDINLRQHFYTEPVIRASLDVAGVLKLNEQELPVVAEMLGLPSNEAAFTAALFERLVGLRLIALTRGPNGSALLTREATSQHAGIRTTLADTVGAGDAFTAAVAVGLLKRIPLDRINDAANRIAAFVCSQPGATPRLPEELATCFPATGE